LAIKETDWLGYWLAPHGLKPWKKKINAILHTDCPCNATELCMFIGCQNYHHDMWQSCAHILKLLTDHSGLKEKAPIDWQKKGKKHLTKCVCLWLRMLSQLISTTISSLT
jgi:hypothetical protein